MRDEQSYLASDAEFLSPALGRVFHFVAKRASGSYVYDLNDKPYLDMTSGIAVNQLGHSHPEIVDEIKKQAELCLHTSCVVHYPANIELAEALARIMPGDLSSTFFCNSGAEAADGAIKLIKILQPGRNNFIVHRGSFHGRTLGATALTTSKASYRKYFDPLIPGVNVINFPNAFAHKTSTERKNFEEQMHKELDLVFATHLAPESVAAIFIEPVLGEGGYLPAPFQFVNYLKHLRQLCDKYGILLVFDEVQSGIARTGKWFASEHYGVVPDIQLMAKGLSGGLPLGAFASRKELMYKMPPGSHGSTYGGNPLSCKAALKMLEIIERDDVMSKVRAKSQIIFDHFEKEFPGSNSHTLRDTSLETPVRVRGLGLMIGLELASAEITTKVKEYAFSKQLLILPCGAFANIIRLAPDLTMSEEDIKKGLEIITEAIKLFA